MADARRSLHVPLFVLLAATIAACAPTEQGVVQGRTGEPVIVLSEGSCGDACPVYDLTLHPDGHYLLNGVSFVKTEGLTEGELGRDNWARAVDVLEDVGFWNLKPKQTADTLANCETESPDVTITWRTQEGKEKTVVYNAGCGVEKMRMLIVDLRDALQFDDLVWTHDRFNPETGQR